MEVREDILLGGRLLPSSPARDIQPPKGVTVSLQPRRRAGPQPTARWQTWPVQKPLRSHRLAHPITPNLLRGLGEALIKGLGRLYSQYGSHSSARCDFDLSKRLRPLVATTWNVELRSCVFAWVIFLPQPERLKKVLRKERSHLSPNREMAFDGLAEVPAKPQLT